MKLEIFVIMLVVGSAFIWLSVFICFIVSLFRKIRNNVFSKVALYSLIPPALYLIVMIFVEGHYAEFGHWLVLVIAGLLSMLNIIFVEKMLRLHRCERCMAWKVVSHCLEDATYETTKEYRDGKCVKESMKLKELRNRVWLCKCKKCGFMYQWWEKGGKYDVEEITEERYNQTNQVTYK